MINGVYLPGHSARITAHGPLRTLFTTSVGPRPAPQFAGAAARRRPVIAGSALLTGTRCADWQVPEYFCKVGKRDEHRNRGGSPGYYLWVNVGVADVLNDGFRGGRSEAVRCFEINNLLGRRRSAFRFVAHPPASPGTGKNRKFPEIRSSIFH